MFADEIALSFSNSELSAEEFSPKLLTVALSALELSAICVKLSSSARRTRITCKFSWTSCAAALTESIASAVTAAVSFILLRSCWN